jgi:hypothetical protein
MNSIRDQLSKLTENWSFVFEAIKKNPQIAQPHLDTISIEQINEVVDTVNNILNQVRAPKGFRPGFDVAKSVASTALSSANISLENLRQGAYGHFPAFILGLNQAVSSIYTCLLRSEINNPIDNVGYELAEKIALIKTAEQELSKKLESLKATEKIAETINSFYQDLQKAPEQAKILLNEIEEQSTLANSANNNISSYEESYKKLNEASAKLYKDIQTSLAEIASQKSEVSDIINSSKKQEATINGLLPRAASAGLASAFSQRVKEMQVSKIIWAIAFFLSIIGLLAIGVIIIRDTSASGLSNLNVFTLMIRRFPILGPLIWLGWFSAVQYGNSLRVQEDYAFKEATSKAFAGYRDHMEHLNTVNIDDSKNALTLLSEKTIEILSHEPLRVFKGTHRDATPTQGVREMINPGNGK